VEKVVLLCDEVKPREYFKESLSFTIIVLRVDCMVYLVCKIGMFVYIRVSVISKEASLVFSFRGITFKALMRY
jgi:hypothetical protein